MKPDAIKMMLDVIRENSPDSIWVGSKLESFRSVANTNRGDIGEEFVRRFLEANLVEVEKSPSRNQEWDLKIYGRKFEVKTASEDVGGAFQFNHIRLDRKYQFLLCLAVRPSEILFGLWSKGEVAEGKAGTLVRMAEGQSITFKLTKKPSQLEQIEILADTIRKKLG
jgi:hypothetical protein